MYRINMFNIMCYVAKPHLQKCSLLLELSNTQPGLTAQSGRRLLFTQVAFGYLGAWLAASDQLGSIYILDLARNR